MPLNQPGQEAPPDFSTHPNYQRIFCNMTDLGQDRDLTTALLLELWRTRAGQEVPQAEPQPQLPGGDAPQHGQADQDEHLQPPQDQPPPDLQLHEPPFGDPEEHPAQHPHQAQGPLIPPPGAPPAPPPVPADDQDWLVPDRADRRAPQLPVADLNAKSMTDSLQRPSTYAIEKLSKFEYVPLWYFTLEGRRTANRDRTSTEDIWDVTKTSDNRLAFRTASSNRPSPNALSDEELNWEQFMDGSHLFCRWLAPLEWPQIYAKVLSSFFWQIENHEEMDIDRGKETLLLYQARQRWAWHDELKANHFFNLSNLNNNKMNLFCREVDARHYAAHRQTVRLAVFFPGARANKPFVSPCPAFPPLVLFSTCISCSAFSA